MPKYPQYFQRKSRIARCKDEDMSSESMAIPLQPSMAYLAVARSASVRTQDNHSLKKLLILDLNGTLLLRPKPRNVKRRPIHPRPYMKSFCSYIFHQTVKPWLEAMVWSSAQPQSVNDMVTRCFEDHRDELKTIWARDTLGLKKQDYFRKFPTVKNLERCWSRLSDPLPSHTAKTTLLIDDSTKKARLQPYNHLSVPEYTKNLRNRDLMVKGTFAQSKESMKQAVEQASSGVDTTLIAVIGILDEIKEQTNVAGWIRAGGLWAGQEPPSRSSSPFELFSDDEYDGYGSNLSTSDGRGSRRVGSKLHATEPSTPSKPGNDIVSASSEEEPTWFEHPPCYQYWVDRGNSVAKALGIELYHGL